MKTLRFGIIGAGLMAREFASAAARWCHLIHPPARPEVVAVCDRNPASLTWFQAHFPTVGQFTSDYTELLANPQIDAVYAAVPHHLHEEIYGAVIRSGKHLMGEKPFGIDLPANTAILHAIGDPPNLTSGVRRSFRFFQPCSGWAGWSRAARSDAFWRPTPGSCIRATSTRPSRSTGSAWLSSMATMG